MIQSLWGTVWRFLKKAKNKTNKLPYNTAILLLGIYLEKAIFKNHMYHNVHCNTIYSGRDMKKPRCTWTDEWIKKIWYIDCCCCLVTKLRYMYTMDGCSIIKRNEIGSFVVMQMNLSSVIQSEISQKE